MSQTDEYGLQKTQQNHLQLVLSRMLQTIIDSTGADTAIIQLNDGLFLYAHKTNGGQDPAAFAECRASLQARMAHDIQANQPRVAPDAITAPINDGSALAGWLGIQAPAGLPCQANSAFQLCVQMLELMLQKEVVQQELQLCNERLEREMIDRQNSERALARRAGQMEVIHDIGLAISSGLHLEEVINELYLQCKRIVNVDVFYVALYNPSNEQLDFPVFIDNEEFIEIPPRSLKTEPSLTGHIVQTQRTFYSPDTTSPDSNLPVKLIVRRGGTSSRSFLGIPLIWREKIIGIISIQSYQPDAYTPAQIQMMETIATQAAAAIEHARVYANLDSAWSAAQDANRDLKKALTKMERLAITDKLTSIYNRRKFDEIIENEIKRAARYRTPLSLLLMDVDRFKRINDTYGHHMGDQVLRQVVRMIKENIRSSDVIARWGGDEIIILTPGIDLQNATLLAEKLRSLMEARSFIRPHADNITMSIGVAQYQPGEKSNDLLRRADAALYQAKSNGRNCVIEN